MTSLQARALPRVSAVAAATAALGVAAPVAHAAGDVEPALPAVEHLVLADDDRPWRLFAFVAPDERVSAPTLLDLVPAETGATEDADEAIHVVAAGESLADVAAAYGIEGEDGWRRLFDANPEVDDPNRIEPGDELRIPDPDEELESRDLPARTATQAPSGGATSVSGSVWDRLAQCEATGNWSANTGNGYYGGLQFHPQTWSAHGGQAFAPNAHQASREQQIAVAERVLAGQGWSAWPSCSRQLGLR